MQYRKKNGRLGFYLRNIADRKTDVYRIILDSTGDHHTAEELTQEVMEKSWRSLDSLRDRDKCWQWIKGIIRNEIKGYFRGKGLEQRYLASAEWADEYAAGEGEPAESIARAEEDVLEILVRQDEKRILVNAVSLLDEREQQIIRLHLVGELTLKEVSEIICTGYDCTRVIYSRSLKKLKRIYLELEEGGEAGE